MREPVFASLWPVAAGATAWCLVFGGLLWGLGTDRSLAAAAFCLAPALLALALGQTSRLDRGPYMARLLACAGLLPVLQLMVAFSNGGGFWRASGAFLGSLTALLVLAFVAGVVAMARAGTGIAAVPGVPPVALSQLDARLQSLARLDLALRTRITVRRAPDVPHWALELRDPAQPAREHRVLLEVDPAAGSVTVRERLAAHGAAPRTAAEASMRAPGEDAFDPARPRAQVLGSRVAQTTVVEPGDLVRVRLQWAADGGVAAAELPPVAGRASPAAAPDAAPDAVPDAVPDAAPDGLRDEAQAWLTLLAAVVTRSGYRWQPTMF